jgi:hypothetical protein
VAELLVTRLCETAKTVSSSDERLAFYGVPGVRSAFLRISRSSHCAMPVLDGPNSKLERRNCRTTHSDFAMQLKQVLMPSGTGVTTSCRRRMQPMATLASAACASS